MRDDRCFLSWLASAVHDRLEGEIVVEDGAKTHRVTVRAGRVLAAYADGLFDPLVAALMRAGRLDDAGARQILEGLGRTSRRSGELASSLCGVPRDAIERALEHQLRARVRYVSLRARDGASSTHFSPRTVRTRELVAFVAIESLEIEGLHGWLRTRPMPAPAPAPKPPTREHARRALREIARRIHPDRHTHLTDAQRDALTRELARATAAYHGFS